MIFLLSTTTNSSSAFPTSLVPPKKKQKSIPTNNDQTKSEFLRTELGAAQSRIVILDASVKDKVQELSVLWARIQILEEKQNADISISPTKLLQLLLLVLHTVQPQLHHPAVLIIDLVALHLRAHVIAAIHAQLQPLDAALESLLAVHPLIPPAVLSLRKKQLMIYQNNSQ